MLKHDDGAAEVTKILSIFFTGRETGEVMQQDGQMNLEKRNGSTVTDSSKTNSVNGIWYLNKQLFLTRKKEFFFFRI